jgi:hypothetical protein
LLLGSAFLIFWVKKSHFEKSVVDMTLFFVFFFGLPETFTNVGFFSSGLSGREWIYFFRVFWW